jgi:hypothetical protein
VGLTPIAGGRICVDSDLDRRPFQSMGMQSGEGMKVVASLGMDADDRLEHTSACRCRRFLDADI